MTIALVITQVERTLGTGSPAGSEAMPSRADLPPP